jgi:regulator of replication initiation timing
MSQPINYGKHWSEVLKELNAENARLEAENERLRKAGDAMAFIMAYEKDEEFDGFVEAWNAAKEGRPNE